MNKKNEFNANGFLNIVKKYSDIEELTLDILQEFIDKIVVHHRKEITGETIQQIEIYYRVICHVEIPQSLLRSFDQKRRTYCIKQYIL